MWPMKQVAFSGIVVDRRGLRPEAEARTEAAIAIRIGSALWP
jgi:hypothetical protein